MGYYLHMQLSRCYRQSGDRLRCITCHNPHFQPPASKTAAYYREKCLQCHTDKSCSQPLASRLRANPPDDCVSCHMTKQPAANFAHTVVTDHRIVARPGEPYPGAAPPNTEQNTNGLIHINAVINAVPYEEASSLTAVVLLQAYAQLLLSHPENANYQEQYRALLRRLAETEPNEAIVLRFLAGAEAQKRTPDAWERGISYMQRAIRLDPSHASDRFWLAQMLGHSGRPLEAAQELEKAISAEPYNPEYYMYLAVCYVSGGRHREGMEAINRALQLFPENEDMRIVLDKVRRPALNQ